MGRHYLGDVTAGLALGLVTAAVITKVRCTLEVLVLLLYVGPLLSIKKSEDFHRFCQMASSHLICATQTACLRCTRH